MKEKMKTIITVIMALLPFMSQAQSIAFTCWTIKGEKMMLTVNDGILKIPDSIAAINLCGAEAIALDCSSANPNCLYYTDGTSSVEGLPNANVVCEGVCEGLLLTDEACFYCPMAFFATDAMLRFTPRCDDEEADFSQPCHETVMLPFDADFVIPADVNGTMPEEWLQVANFQGIDGDKLLFIQTYEECLKANFPYLVTFAYGAYGTQILFCGQDKTVEETSAVNKGEGTYCFTGSTLSKEEEPGYFRYHRGQESYFIHTGDGMPMEPFRCFIVSVDLAGGEQASSFGQILRYVVFDVQNTRIDTHCRPFSSKACYDLQGRLLPDGNRHKGIYITGGVKVIK